MKLQRWKYFREELDSVLIQSQRTSIFMEVKNSVKTMKNLDNNYLLQRQNQPSGLGFGFLQWQGSGSYRHSNDVILLIIKDQNDWIGPPNKNGVTKEVTINPDTTCGNDWVCEHRWRQIRQDVPFRSCLIRKFLNLLF